MMSYKSITGSIYEIIGWHGDVLQTRTNGRVFTLTRQHTINLLKSLGLAEADIPGKFVKWSGWDAE